MVWDTNGIQEETIKWLFFSFTTEPVRVTFNTRTWIPGSNQARENCKLLSYFQVVTPQRETYASDEINAESDMDIIYSSSTLFTAQ